MAQSVLIIGESGHGKSHSVQFLDPKETFIINVANKSLPFQGWRSNYSYISKDNPEGNMSKVSTPGGIRDAMEHVNDNMPHIKNLIIDDWQYMSAFEFFDRADEDGWQKFTDIGKWLKVISTQPMSMRDDLTVFFLTHSEEVEDRGRKKQKAKTIGKMVDEKLTLEGLFPIVLYSRARKDTDGEMEYGFETKTDGKNTCKSPLGMFEDEFIDNNLQIVKEKMIEYES